MIVPMEEYERVVMEAGEARTEIERLRKVLEEILEEVSTSTRANKLASAALNSRKGKHDGALVNDTGKETLAWLASTGRFTLFDSTQVNGRWRSLKLVRAGAPPQQWWFAWDGARLTRNADAFQLQTQDPDIYQWVVETLRGIPCQQKGQT